MQQKGGLGVTFGEHEFGSYCRTHLEGLGAPLKHSGSRGRGGHFFPTYSGRVLKRSDNG